MSIAIEVVAICPDYSQPCDACGASILDHNWRLEIHVIGNKFVVHDNEGVCYHTFLVKKGLASPSFLSSRIV